MPRNKEFNNDLALRGAIAEFSRKGFAATSTDDLMQAMGIGRQSMYDTFGDKRALFLKALKVYSTENVGAIVEELLKAGSPLAGIRNALIEVTERPNVSDGKGCMGINAICEFGLTDSEVLLVLKDSGSLLRQVLLQSLRRAKAEGEIPADANIASLADFIDVTLSGIRIAAKAGKGRAALKRIVEMAVKAMSVASAV